MSSVDYSQFKDVVYHTLCRGIIFGAYIVVYVTSVCVLLRKPGFASSRPRMIMFGITTFMFALGIIALVLVTTLQFLESQLLAPSLDPSNDLWPSYFRHYNVWATIARLLYILCNIICAWRTVVLWNRDKRVLAILLLFILGTIATAGYTLGVIITQPSHGPTLTLGKLDLIWFGPTLGTNLLSTGLIAWKAWQHRISVRNDLCQGSGSVRVDRVFALLIESGLIYCCIWILYRISASGALPFPGFTIMVFFSGVYPTLIIILVSMQMSPVEHYSRHSPEIQVTPGPALGPPSAGSTPRHVLKLQHEHTSDFDTQILSTVYMKTSDEEKSPLQ